MGSHHFGSLEAILLATALAAASCAAPASPPRSVASHLIMGGPPECAARITCLLGLRQIYGFDFKSFKALDEVGPLSVAALADNRVQVVRLDSSDPSIPQHQWVILQDDKSFQKVGNIIPVIRSSKATEEITSLLNGISGSMTQGDLFMLDTMVAIGHHPPQDVARAYVEQKGLGAVPGNGAKETITIGSAAFSENEILAYIYMDVLTSAGYTVTASVGLGSREVYEPALEKGQIDLVPEYVGNYLSFLDPTSNTVALATAVPRLRVLLAAKGVTVLDPSSATDSDTVVVTRATADKFHLTKISDLGNRAPS